MNNNDNRHSHDETNEDENVQQAIIPDGDYEESETTTEGRNLLDKFDNVEANVEQVPEIGDNQAAENEEMEMENGNMDDNNTNLVTDDAFWETLVPPTEKWISYGIKQAGHFTSNTLFGNQKGTFFAMNKPFMKLANISATQTVTVGIYKNIFEECITKNGKHADTKEGKKVRWLVSKLALSDPTETFHSWMWQGKNLKNYNATCAWVAAHYIFGSPWKNRTKEKTTNKHNQEQKGNEDQGEKSTGRNNPQALQKKTEAKHQRSTTQHVIFKNLRSKAL